jgi:hypothetical protein
MDFAGWHLHPLMAVLRHGTDMARRSAAGHISRHRPSQGTALVPGSDLDRDALQVQAGVHKGGEQQA